MSSWAGKFKKACTNRFQNVSAVVATRDTAIRTTVLKLQCPNLKGSPIRKLLLKNIFLFYEKGYFIYLFKLVFFKSLQVHKA